MNVKRLDIEIEKLEKKLFYLKTKRFIKIADGIDPPPHQLQKQIDVRGREEHEAILKDAVRCEELGLDQHYEIWKYLKRWGGWL